jgi:O-antigen/teichoic acid export membrane protein
MLNQSLSFRLQASRKKFLNDSLFRNATYLIASTSIMAVLGFVFWLLVAHWFKPAEIGIASALISVATLLSSLSLLGMNAGLIRFLNGSDNQSRDINAASLIVVAASVVTAIAYVIVAPHLGVKLALLNHLWQKVAFVVLMAVVSLNSLTDSVFIGNRKGEYHTVGYATFSIVKLAIPALLISLGALGIFSAYALAMLISLVVSYYLMFRRLNYHFSAKPNWQIIRTIRAYAANNYFGIVLSNLPAQLLPLFIIRRLGAADVAYYAMASTMANLLYILPAAAGQSLLAETAHEPSKMAEHLRRIVKLLVYLLIPVVILSVFAAPYLLSIFGLAYKQNGTGIFRLLAAATFLVAISTIGNTILNIEKHSKAIVGIQAIILIVTFASSIWLIKYGLSGIGLALLIGYIAASIAHIKIFTYYHKINFRDLLRRNESSLSPFKNYRLDGKRS